MKNKKDIQKPNFSVFCWNIANPSEKRAGKQAVWLRKRPEDVLALTETKASKGCLLIEKYFKAFGYNVIFSKPEGKEFGTMIISKHFLSPGNFSDLISFLPFRVSSAVINFQKRELEIINVYVPSRNASKEKISKKKRFLRDVTNAVEKIRQSTGKIFCGDFNVLEPNHIPHYSFFQKWEYDFYQDLIKHRLQDAFRYLNPEIQEYSWVGRTGDGYRYDHCFVSHDLLPFIRKCYYLHEPRETKLSDHSTLILELNL